MFTPVVVPFRAGNSVCDNPTIATHLDITRLKLMSNTVGLLSNSVARVSEKSVARAHQDCDYSDLGNEVSSVAAVVPEEDKVGGVSLLDMISENKNNWVSSDDVTNRESEEDDSLSLEGDPILDSSCSLSVTSETSSLCGEDFLSFEASSEVGTLSSVDIEKSICSVDIIAKAGDLPESNIETEIVSNPLAVAVSLEEEVGNESKQNSPSVVLQLALEKGVRATVGRSVFEVDYVPLWGFTSVCGRRPEMEDAVATVPYYLKIPIQMLIGDQVVDGLSNRFSQQTAHFFGVYDGHGGSQVPLFSPLSCL